MNRTEIPSRVKATVVPVVESYHDFSSHEISKQLPNRNVTHGLGDATRQLERDYHSMQSECLKLRDNQARLLQEVDEARQREIQNATQVRTLTEHYQKAQQDLTRYHEAWTQAAEKEKIVRTLLSEHEERKGLAAEVINEIAMLRSQYTCEKTSREELERRNRALELELTRFHSANSLSDERVQSQSKLLEQARQEVRYLQGLQERHQHELAQIREQVASEIRSEMESRFQSELTAQKSTFDRLITEIEARYGREGLGREALLKQTTSELEKRYQSEIDAIKKSHALVLANKESRHFDEIEKIQALTDRVVNQLEQRHKDDWAMIKVRIDQFVDSERSALTRQSEEQIDQIRTRLQTKIDCLIKDNTLLIQTSEDRETQFMSTAQSEIAELKGQAAAAQRELTNLIVKQSSEQALSESARAAVDQLAQSRVERSEVQKQQFLLLKELMIYEKSKVRGVADRLNEMSREEIREHLVRLAEIKQL